MKTTKKQRLEAAAKYHGIRLIGGDTIDVSDYDYNTINAFKGYCIANGIDVFFVNTEIEKHENFLRGLIG